MLVRADEQLTSRYIVSCSLACHQSRRALPVGIRKESESMSSDMSPDTRLVDSRQKRPMWSSSAEVCRNQREFI